MAWQQLKLNTTAQHVESITDWLNLLGAVAITWMDAAGEPILEPELNTMPVWTATQVIGLFDTSIDINKVLELLRAQLGAEIITQHEVEQLADQDWERAWMKDFHPMHFGHNLWICPTHIMPPDPNATNIILDPGLAFGTGTHPTTALCLQWLAENPPRDKVVIDYGCGSGILAIAALKLGAREVWAIDHDPQALEATHNNAQANQLDLSKLHILAPEQFKPVQADVVLANIIANPLILLAPKFATLLKPNGQIVLSGILKEQAEEVISTYQQYFRVTPPIQLDEWVRIECKSA